MHHDLALSSPAIRSLAGVGLRLGGLASTARLDAASRIEGPTSIQSAVAGGALIDVGAFCNLSGGQINNVVVGRYVSIADGVVVGAHEHPTDWLTTSRTSYYPEVHGWDRLMMGDAAEGLARRIVPYTGSCPVTTLGPDVWIGQGAFVKAGVTVGAGAVIGARATVLKDVPPYAIVVGTPARVIRLRFPDALVERMLAVQWWRYAIYDLFAAPMNRPEAVLDHIEDRVAAGTLHPYVGPVLGPADLTDPEAVAAQIRAAARRASEPQAGPGHAQP
ncbi:MAG: CatB-related O-acetyltransferase [Rhodobacteraceae bacterium]|nr:CatB-related O-acetyltransferase [Paracoccaceae bacterium]